MHVLFADTGVVHDTFAESAIARGLRQDDQAAVATLHEAAVSAMPSRLRHLFATLLLCGIIDNVNKVWVLFKQVYCASVCILMHR